MQARIYESLRFRKKGCWDGSILPTPSTNIPRRDIQHPSSVLISHYMLGWAISKKEWNLELEFNTHKLLLLEPKTCSVVKTAVVQVVKGDWNAPSGQIQDRQLREKWHREVLLPCRASPENVVNYGNVVMNAIKYTSKAVLPAGRSIHTIICISPCRWGLFSKGKFHKIKKCFSFLCSRGHASYWHFQHINSLLLPAPTLSAMPFSVGPWSFQSVHTELCSFALKLSTQKRHRCNFYSFCLWFASNLLKVCNLLCGMDPLN